MTYNDNGLKKVNFLAEICRAAGETARKGRGEK